MNLYFVGEALERLEEVTKTRRANGDPMRHDEFAALEKARFVEWCEASPDHAQAVGELAAHLLGLIEATIFRFGLDEAHDIIDASFGSMRRSIGA